MDSSKQICKNCNCLIAEDEKYCSICGQKKITRPLSVFTLVYDFIDNLFSLEGKLFRSLFPLFFRPGFLTIQYLQGRRKSYFSPVRLFLFFLTLNLILFAFWISPRLTDMQQTPKELFLQQMQTDSICHAIQQTLQDSVELQRADSICQAKAQNLSNEFLDSINIVIGGDNTPISKKDMFLLPFDSLASKYDINGFWKRILLHQSIKTLQTPNAFGHFLIGHQSWAIFFSIPLIALLLKLLYWRSKRYYAEHLVFTLHLHAFVFAIFSLLLIWIAFWQLYASPLASLLTSLAIIGIYTTIAFKKVYQQSILKTGIKLILFSIGYTIIITLSLIVLLVLGFAFF